MARPIDSCVLGGLREAAGWERRIASTPRTPRPIASRPGRTYGPGRPTAQVRFPRSDIAGQPAAAVGDVPAVLRAGA